MRIKKIHGQKNSHHSCCHLLSGIRCLKELWSFNPILGGGLFDAMDLENKDISDLIFAHLLRVG